MGSSTGDLLVDDERLARRIIASIARRAAFHAEDEARLKARKHLREPGDPATHPEWRDEQAALIATQRLLRLAETHGKRVHVLHVTTAEEMAFLAQRKDRATVEVTPHHLTLAAPECYERLGTFAQMNPPVRDERHRQALWAALPAAWSTCSAPTTRRTRGRRRRTPIPRAFGHARRADAGAHHARPRQRRAAQPGALRRPHQRRPRAGLRHRAARAASRSATTRTSPSST